MGTIKKILVPTDFSETAENALNAAILIAVKQKAEVYLVHFYHVGIQLDVIGQPMFLPEEDAEAVSSRDRLIAIKRFVQLRYPNVTLHGLVHQGFMADALPFVCEVNDIDLIVSGTNGSDWLGDGLLGTNTNAIVRETTVPVLVIPRKATLRKIEKIAFATEFQFDDLEVIEKVATSLAKPFNASIEVVHVSKSLRSDQDTLSWMEEMADQRIKYPFVSFENLTSSESPAEALKDFVALNDVDLLVLTTKGKNVFQRILSGSFSRQMVQHAHLPMLVYHIHDHKIA